MAITVATVFTDLGKLLSAFANCNGFAGSQSPTNVYTFTVSSANATVGATYTNNGVTYTVLQTISSGTTLLASGTSAPAASGTLTKATGTGDSTITFSAFTSAGLWGASGPIIKSQSTMTTDILTRLEGAGLTDLIPYGQWQGTIQAIDSALQSQKSVLQQLVEQVIIKRVNNDTPQQSSTSFEQAIAELIRQMQSQSKSVKSCTVSAATTAGSGNTGNATVYATVIDQNGLTLEYSYPETLTLKCTQDQFSGGTAGSETLTITSKAQVSDTLSCLWPGGSGLNTTTTVVDPTLGFGNGGNLIGATSALGAFKDWSGSTPTGWVIDVDSTNISDGTTNKYAGTNHCLAITGNTGGTNLNTALYQNFANGSITGGTTETLLPNTVYQFYCQVKADVVPAAGAIQFSLTDGSGTVINNNAGTANTITSTISGFGSTSYQTVKGTFQTPTVMPTTARLRIKASTKITTGSIVYIDYMALTAPSTTGYGGLYAGGPFLSVFRGSVDLINYVSPTIGDYWTVAISNDQASSSPTPLSFNPMLNQLCGMASLGYILPSSGSPTEANSLIS